MCTWHLEPRGGGRAGRRPGRAPQHSRLRAGTMRLEKNWGSVTWREHTGHQAMSLCALGRTGWGQSCTPSGCGLCPVVPNRGPEKEVWAKEKQIALWFCQAEGAAAGFPAEHWASFGQRPEVVLQAQMEPQIRGRWGRLVFTGGPGRRRIYQVVSVSPLLGVGSGASGVVMHMP